MRQESDGDAHPRETMLMRKIFRCQEGKDGGLEDTAHQNQWTDDKNVEKGRHCRL